MVLLFLSPPSLLVHSYRGILAMNPFYSLIDLGVVYAELQRPAIFDGTLIEACQISYFPTGALRMQQQVFPQVLYS